MKRIPAPNPIITKDSKILEKVKSVVHDDETMLVCEPLIKHHAHGGKDKRILVLTYQYLSLVRVKTFGGVDRKHENSICELKKIFFGEPETFTLTFEKETLSFSASYGKKICEMILYQHSVLFYGQPNQLIVESNPQGVISSIRHQIRPYSLTSSRLLAFTYMNQTRPTNSSIKFFKDYDNRFTPTLKLTQLTSADSSDAVGKIIGMDPDVKNLLLDNFNLKNIDLMLPAIFKYSNSITTIIFENYRDSPQQQFDLLPHERTGIKELSFKNCCFPFVSKVLNGMQKFSGRIISLKIERCKLTSAEIKELFELLHKYPAFMRIRFLYLNDGTVDQMDLHDFQMLLPKARYLKFLSINKTNVQTGAILKTIFQHAVALANISITNCNFLEPLEDDVQIPPCVSMIDISNNQITEEALRSLSNLMFLKPRRNAITFYASELASSATQSELLDAFLVENPRPVLTEFRWNRNELSPEDTERLLNFLRTQKTLKYLALSGCFVDDIPESFNYLSQFVKEGRIQGLELSSCPGPQYPPELVKLLKTFVGVQALQILNLERSMMGDEGLEVVQEIVDANHHMQSISCDGAKPKSLQVLMHFYEHIANVQHLTGVGVPRVDFASFQRSPSTIPGLKNKGPPSSATHRLILYEKVSTQIKNDQGPRDIQDILLDSGFNQQALTNPIEELIQYVGFMVNPPKKEKNNQEENKPKEEESDDEEDDSLNMEQEDEDSLEIQNNKKPKKAEKDKKEKTKKEEKKPEEPKVRIPSPEELTSTFLSCLMTSSVAVMSNRFQTLEMIRESNIAFENEHYATTMRGPNFISQRPNTLATSRSGAIEAPTRQLPQNPFPTERFQKRSNSIFFKNLNNV